MGCASVLTDALAGAGVKNVSRIAPNQGRTFVIVVGAVPGGKLGEAAEKVNAALTPHRETVKPTLSLELYVDDLDEETQAKAIKALEKVEGVDAEKSKVFPKRGVISVRLVGGAKLTTQAIIDALGEAGVEAKIVTGDDKKAEKKDEKEQDDEKEE